MPCFTAKSMVCWKFRFRRVQVWMASWSARLPAWADSMAAANAMGSRSLFMDLEVNQSSPRPRIQTGFKWDSNGKQTRNCWVSPPELAVEGSVLDGFGNMLEPHVFRLGQIGDGPSHLEHPVIGAGREIQVRQCVLEKQEGGGIELDKLLEFAGTQSGVAGNGSADQPMSLAFAGRFNPLSDLLAGFPRARPVEVGESDGRNLDVQVDPVEQGAGNAAQIRLDFSGTGA